MQSINGISDLAFYQREFDNRSTASTGTVRVTGGTIHWPNDGWYEVQYAESYNTLSEGGRSASPGPGVYNVINHTTGERFEGVVVSDDLETDNSYHSRSRSTSDTEEDPVYTQTTTTSTTYPDTTPEDYRSDRNSDAAIGVGLSTGGLLLGGPVTWATGVAAVAFGAAGGVLQHRLGASETVTTTHGIDSDGSAIQTQSGDTRHQDAGHEPLSSTTTSTITYESGRQVTTVTDGLTGEQRIHDVNANGVATSTVSTADTSAASSPRTNRTTDEDGVTTETRTSPTGGTYSASTVGQNEGDGSTVQQTDAPEAQPTRSTPTRDPNRNSDSDTDNGPGGGGVSSSESAEQGGWGSSELGEFG